MQAVFDKASGRSRGQLSPKDARRTLTDSVRRSKVPKEELDVLVKRYEIVNRDGTRSVDTKRLVDDLVVGKVAQPQWGASTTPRTAAADAAKLTELTNYIAGQVNKGAGPQALFAAFSRAERG